MIPKIIWHYWSHPWKKDFLQRDPITRACLQSWKKLNPDWEIRMLDETTVNEWFDYDGLFSKIVGIEQTQDGKYLHPKLAAISDMIRVGVLANHGGVYADVDVFCNRPLDEWIHDADFYVPPSSKECLYTDIVNDREGSQLKPGKRNMETWFVSTTKNNKITTQWNNKHHEYWCHPHKFKPFYYWSISCLQDVLVEHAPDHYDVMREMVSFDRGVVPASIMQAIRCKEDLQKINMLDVRVPWQVDKVPVWKLKRGSALDIAHDRVKQFPANSWFVKLCNRHAINI